MSIQSEITRLASAKTSIADAIEGKGVQVPESTRLNAMADLINLIATVSSVNGKTGAVELDADDVGARPSTWTPTKNQVGLGNVDNVKQYSESNPPPYPVTSVNGQTGNVTVESGTESTMQQITLTTNGWTNVPLPYAGTIYEQQKSVSGVTVSTPVVLVDVALTGTDLDADAAALEAWGLVSANNATQGAGILTFYTQEIPSVNIPVNVGVC